MSYHLRRDVLSWGRVVRRPQLVASPRRRDELPDLVRQRPGTTLAVGLQRSYGDSVLNEGAGLVSMPGLDRLIAFDPGTGRLRAEAGITLDAILRLTVPQGWFLPTTPGTRFATLGGAVANDVHGKNHHRAGTFGRHVTALGLIRGDGGRVVAAPDVEPGLFAATIGGLGLTGVIEWAEIGLTPITGGYLETETIAFRGLPEFFAHAAMSDETHEHTVAWIDCAARGQRFGRGLFSRANWSNGSERTLHRAGSRVSVPVAVPRLLNGSSLRPINAAYYHLYKRGRKLRQHYAPFLYPLDSIANWNRLHGRRGFWQYQCAFPTTTMRQATATLLNELARSDQRCCLAVLKTFGALPSPGLLSFPMEGATLALDFPNHGQPTLQLFSRFDAIVREAGGRLYAAKDGRIPRDMWTAGYPQLDRFVSFVDPAFASNFWLRVRPQS